MSVRRIVVIVAIAAAIAFAAAGCSGSGKSDSASGTTAAGANGDVRTGAQPRTIAEVAATDPDLTSFLTALSTTDLAQTLAGTGPYTVFIPTNAGLVLPQGTLDPATARKELSSILAYHVVKGALTTADLQPGTLTTLNGATLTVTRDGDTVVLTDSKGNKARIVKADIKAENGEIQVIDKVLLPPGS